MEVSPQIQQEAQKAPHRSSGTSPEDEFGTPESAGILSRAPTDVLILVVGELSLKDIARFSRTAQVYHRRMWTSPTLWKRLYQRDISRVRYPAGDHSLRAEYCRILTEQRKHKTVEAVLYYAASQGYERRVESLLSCDSALNIAMGGAAYGGHIDIVLDMMRRGQHSAGATTWEWATQCAIEGHQFEVMREIIGRIKQRGGNQYWDGCMIAAARGGDTTIVAELIKHGANNWNGALSAAAQGGHLDLVKDMIGRGATEMNLAMLLAAVNGYTAIVKELIRHGANEWCIPLMVVSQHVHLDIVREMVEQMRASNYSTMNHDVTSALADALNYNHSAVAAYLRETRASLPPL